MGSTKIQPVVFISYAKEDHDFACEIYLALKSNEIVPWMDKPPAPFRLEGLLPGQNWPLEIEQRIGDADYVLLILSKNSIEKQGFVQTEFRFALQFSSRRPPNRLYVIPILKAACDVPLLAVGTIKLNDLHWTDYSAEGIGPLVEAIRRDFKPTLPTEQIGAKRAPLARSIQRPRVKWHSQVGRLHWRNNIHTEDDTLFVSSSGERWNYPDAGDGVYCLNKHTGSILWNFNSKGDANELFVTNDRVLVGTDGGQLAILDKSTGALVGDHNILDPIFGRPFVLRSPPENRVLAISHKGTVLLAEPESGSVKQIAALPFRVRANVSVCNDQQSAILFAETGEIVRIWVDMATPFSWELLSRKSYFQPELHRARQQSTLVSTPTLENASVFGGVVRDTRYSAPPLFRYDWKRKQFLWGERDHENGPTTGHFGNMRSQPVIIGEWIVFAPAYNAGLFAASKETGEVLYEIRTGQELFQQWSSPVIVDSQRIIFARADGILYQINLVERKIEWFMSLLINPPETRFANRSGQFWLGPGELVDNGITATPIWDGACAFVGTTEGSLFCIENDT